MSDNTEIIQPSDSEKIDMIKRIIRCKEKPVIMLAAIVTVVEDLPAKEKPLSFLKGDIARLFPIQ